MSPLHRREHPGRVDAALCGFEGGDHCGGKSLGRCVAAEIRGREAADDGIFDAAIEQAGGLAASRDPGPLVEPVQEFVAPRRAYPLQSARTDPR